MYVKCIKKLCDNEKFCWRRHPVLDKHYLNPRERENFSLEQNYLVCLKSRIAMLEKRETTTANWTIYTPRCISEIERVKI